MFKFRNLIFSHSVHYFTRAMKYFEISQNEIDI